MQEFEGKYYKRAFTIVQIQACWKNHNIAKLAMQHHNRVFYVISLLNNKIEDALELES
jgi:hypothetical protein